MAKLPKISKEAWMRGPAYLGGLQAEMEAPKDRDHRLTEMRCSRDLEHRDAAHRETKAVFDTEVSDASVRVHTTQYSDWNIRGSHVRYSNGDESQEQS